MQNEKQVFDGVTVELDGNSFIGCTFRNVIFKYAGGDVEMSECIIESFQFQFDGALATGLFTLYQLFGTDGMLKVIEGFTRPMGDGPIVIDR